MYCISVKNLPRTDTLAYFISTSVIWGKKFDVTGTRSHDWPDVALPGPQVSML